eukprot:750762-Prorocentrum_minimum.AAC.1
MGGATFPDCVIATRWGTFHRPVLFRQSVQIPSRCPPDPLHTPSRCPPDPLQMPSRPPPADSLQTPSRLPPDPLVGETS